MAKGATEMVEFALGLDEETAEEAKPKAKAAKAEPRKMYTIFIDEEENKANYETVSVNGKVWKIPRGVDFDVPIEVIEVLKNAIASRRVETANPVTGLIDAREQQFHRIPYRIVRM